MVAAEKKIFHIQFTIVAYWFHRLGREVKRTKVQKPASIHQSNLKS